MKVKLVKISEVVSQKSQQSDIPVGFVITGDASEMPKVGNRFNVESKKLYLNEEAIVPVFSTSHVVEELDKDNHFKTSNSVYKLEIIK